MIFHELWWYLYVVANSRALLAHLSRRAGFGATPAELDVAERDGWDATIRRLVKGLHETDAGLSQVLPPQFLPFASEVGAGAASAKTAEFLALTNWWLDLMLSTPTPFREKLVLFLHEQFPTAYSKVNYPSLLYRQNAIFRDMGHGPFDTLTIAISKDPAMLIWLDAGTDLVAHPNENFARELMERFALGIGHYTESDVKQLARCFTGWALNYQTGLFTYSVAEHDFGVKTFLGHSGAFTGEQAIEIVTKETASAHWIVSRFWSWLAFPVGPNHPVVANLAPLYAKNRHFGSLLESILKHPEFVSTQSTTGLVKQPVEYTVGTLRALQLTTASFPSGYVMNLLIKLGQQLFNPPTVGGWGANGFWLSTAASLTRLDFAQTAASLGNLSRIEDEAPRARIDALANMLGIEKWTKHTTTVLHAAKDNPVMLTSLGLVAPEYVMN
ncbi:MAG TPA: DUF1800 family protein [Acidimicrobiales bacterium]|nr:DUF1800 family protein [Acidimicrobiales bacterium]